ncbi:hypothetical protein [Candidatus Blastococcus massiliensis]|uniref:hypothetical protein n=1 Tax=Candidatus Blastococcus massiliensis TaxID=1470358 RepID=UPI00058FBA1E|nr:hypothetical protein [Candidatus Blastococcus massiliensis]
MPAATARPGRSTLFLIGLAALLGTLVGAVGAAFFVANVVVDGAEIGSDIADELQAAVRDGVIEGNDEVLERTMEEFGGVFEGMPGMPGMPGEDVDEFPPVPPEALGPDPVLDEYAQQCFEGELQACDDLLYESPPMSDYEEYASTCGGRVKPYTVFACTELE